jgi:hypothetical protein
MEHNSINLTNFLKYNNHQAEKQHTLEAVAFLDAIESPTLEESEALDKAKRNRISEPLLKVTGEPAFDAHKNLLWANGPPSSTGSAPRICSNFHLYDTDLTQFDRALVGREYEPRDWAIDHDEEYRWAKKESSFLEIVQTFCEHAKLNICVNHRCQLLKAKLDQAMPTCESWPNLRQWALVAASCQLSAAAAGFQFLDRFSFYQFENLLRIKQSSGLNGDAQTTFEVCQIAFFLLSEVQSRCTILKNGYLSYQHHDRRLWAWNSGGLPRHLTLLAVRQATDKAQKLNICLNRLWNLAYSTERGQDDLPELIELAGQCPNRRSFAHKGHDQCSATFCRSANDTSTLVQQLHKCSEKKCAKVGLPMEQINAAVMSDQSTAWPINNITSPSYSGVSIPVRNVMAVSHVWLDGTGIGTGTQGTVNNCLISYFVDVARRIDCDAIWWDTICIPTEKQARRKTISRMHENYSSATHTIVHDQYLLQFEWAEDGSPALALILSPWFTRGWTALELASSKSVKVIYRDPWNPSQQVIKDLDQDILSKGPFCKLGYSIASTLIRRLRNNEPGITDVLRILQTRTTSWAQDRLAIAAMLCGTQDFDYGDTPAITTRKIMSMYREISLKFLLHGHDTISSADGGFSWCPSNILYALPTTAHRLPSRSLDMDTAFIDDYGAAIASFHYRPLTETDKDILVPYSQHMSVEFRIRKALEKEWEHCLLLQCTTSVSDPLPALLVTAIGLSWPYESYQMWTPGPYLQVRYVGCVLDASSLRGKYSQFTVGVRIGCDINRPTISAVKVLAWLKSTTLRRFHPHNFAFNALKLDTVDEAQPFRRRLENADSRRYGGWGNTEYMPCLEPFSRRLEVLWLLWPRGLSYCYNPPRRSYGKDISRDDADYTTGPSSGFGYAW